MNLRQYIKPPLPFEIGKEYSLVRDPLMRFTISKIVMCAKIELGVNFFMGKYSNEFQDSMLHGNALIPETEKIPDLPEDEDWYICYFDRIRQPMKYDKINQVWFALDGDCWSPETNDIKWLNDKKNYEKI